MATPALAGALKRVIAAEAVAWVQAVDKAIDPGAAQAELFAKEEFQSAALVAREMVVEQARGLIAAVVKAIKTGLIPEAWDTPDQVGELITTGLKQYDPRVAFQATLRSSYAAGREDRIASDSSLTHKVYRTMRDSRVRDSHAALNGVCLPVGDPFWETHSAPNGSRCRCRCYGADQEAIDRLKVAGVPLQFEAPAEAMVTYTNKFTGETQTLPASVEPGWGWKPGSEEGARRLAEMLKFRMNAIRNANLTDF